MPLAARAVVGPSAADIRGMCVNVVLPSDATRAAGTGLCVPVREWQQEADHGSGAWNARALMPVPCVRGREGLNAGGARSLGIEQGPHRLVVRTSRCGRDNPGSTPGVDILCISPTPAAVLHKPVFYFLNKT